MKYRKRPVVVDALQFTGADVELPDWVLSSVHDFLISDFYPDGIVRAQILTLEDVMKTAEIGDWIIRGVKGEIYLCKPDIFALTYEEADREQV